jgi:hypothetical protein
MAVADAKSTMLYRLDAFIFLYPFMSLAAALKPTASYPP